MGYRSAVDGPDARSSRAADGPAARSYSRCQKCRSCRQCRQTRQEQTRQQVLPTKGACINILLSTPERLKQSIHAAFSVFIVGRRCNYHSRGDGGSFSTVSDTIEAFLLRSTEQLGRLGRHSCECVAFFALPDRIFLCEELKQNSEASAAGLFMPQTNSKAGRMHQTRWTSRVRRRHHCQQSRSRSTSVASHKIFLILVQKKISATNGVSRRQLDYDLKNNYSILAQARLARACSQSLLATVASLPVRQQGRTYREYPKAPPACDAFKRTYLVLEGNPVWTKESTIDKQRGVLPGSSD